jgi:predicted DNA-binding antitoxin AbrB/MazE fold protein
LPVESLLVSITIEATYENGVLKPVQPLPFREREQVQVTVRRPTSLADQTFGMIGWSGDGDAFDRFYKETEGDRLEVP